MKSSIVLVLGAAGGIGQAVCQILKPEVNQLFLNGRSAGRLSAHAGQLGLESEQLCADMGTEQGRSAIAEFVARNSVDVVINLIGKSQFVSFTEQTPEAVSEIINTNLTAPVLLTQSLLKIFSQRGSGQIIHVGSALGAIGLPGYASYSASKFGLRGFCEALGRELGESAVQVRYFAPRATATSINSDSVVALNRELGNRTDSPEYVAQALMAFIDSRRAEQQLGWPERLFVRVNGAAPQIVSSSIKKQLPIYRKYLEETRV